MGTGEGAALVGARVGRRVGFIGPSAPSSGVIRTTTPPTMAATATSARALHKG